MTVDAGLRPTSTVPTGVPVSEARYCTVPQAEEAGMDPTAPPADQDQAVADASRLVEQYTTRYFVPVVTTVSAVIYQGEVVASVPIWEVESIGWPATDGSTYPGPMLWDGQDTVAQCYDGTTLVNGWEHWGSRSAQSVRVTGTVGYLTTPLGVRRATARLAALLLPVGFVGASDAEGNATGRVPGLPPVDDLTDPGPPRKVPDPVDRATLSTGDAVADALLDPYRVKVRLT
jgi:hypothetical protein